jgi:hypothetical protein
LFADPALALAGLGERPAGVGDGAGEGTGDAGLVCTGLVCSGLVCTGLVRTGAGLVTAWVCAVCANSAANPTAAAVLSWAAQNVSRDRWRRPLVRAASAGSSSQVG